MRKTILALAWCRSGAVASRPPRPDAPLIMRGDVAIDVIDEGKGPLMVLLPSSSATTRGLRRGRRGGMMKADTLRPQPRVRAKPGPTKSLTLHDLGSDVARSSARSKASSSAALGNWVARG